MKNYNIGDIEDFDENVFNEMTNKSGEQYNELNDDEFCIDTNIYKCIELLNAKMKAKPNSKPDPKPAQNHLPRYHRMLCLHVKLFKMINHINFVVNMDKK